MSGDGVAADSAGSLYFITGDGAFDASTGGSDYGDSFVKLSPSGSVLDYFAPMVQASLNSGTSISAPAAHSFFTIRRVRTRTRW